MSFYGIATLPMQAPEPPPTSGTERAIAKLGLKGTEIGSNINGTRISTIRSSSRCGQVANQHNAFCMVHPNNVAGIERMKNYYLNNLIGNPLDTTIAAACLVFKRRDRAHPNIRFYMVHGGGFTPYQAGKPLAARRHSRRAAKGIEEASQPKPSAPSTGDTICAPSRGLNSWCRIRRGPRHPRQRLPLRHGHVQNAPGRSGAVVRPRWTSSPCSNGLVQKLLAGVK